MGYFKSWWKDILFKSKIAEITSIYLKDKKKYNDNDIAFINEDLNSINLKDTEILSIIINNNDILSKIPNNSINLNYSYSILSLLNLNVDEICRILTKDSFTKILLKKCKSFEDFYNLYMSNKEIYDSIKPRSLIFNNADNEAIYDFLLTNPNFIGKFNPKYLDLFSIIEITKISKDSKLDSDSFSSILEKLYKYNNEDANTYFSIDN